MRRSSLRDFTSTTEMSFDALSSPMKFLQNPKGSLSASYFRRASNCWRVFSISVSRTCSSMNRCISFRLGSSSWYLETKRRLSMPARACSKVSFELVRLRPDEFTAACVLASFAMQNSADNVYEIVQTASGFLIAAILSTPSRVSEICQTLSGFSSDGRDSLPSAYGISATASRNFEPLPNQGGAFSQAPQSAVWKPPFLGMTLRGS